ncbi:MAG TPA: zinc-binding dehydrogenase [Devosia sp.]|nr:zinc-binding dehydrogenase [Devosia sp.]
MSTPDRTLPQRMLAIAIATPGGPEVLQPVREPVPQPGPGEVLIRVAAAGINSPDLQQRRGSYPPPPGASPLPGLEVAGEIAALGPDAGRFAPGARVVALCNGGGYAEYAAVPEGQVLPLPQGWSFAEGAALPETYFTIQQTLVMRADLAPGMHVLIHGGAGGIGGAAIAISKLHGAKPIAVVSSADKQAYCLRLGAVAAIDRTREDFVARAREIAGGGVERIIDIVGGETLARNLEAAATEAHLLLLAALSGAHADINTGYIVGKRLTLHGSTLRPQPPEVKAAIAASLMEKVWPALSRGEVEKPAVETFRLEEAAEAHRSMERPAHYGKTVLVTDFGRNLPA